MELLYQYRTSFLKTWLGAGIVILWLVTGGLIAAEVDRIAAVLGDDIVTLSDINWLIAYRGITVPREPDEEASFYRNLLDQIINSRLIAQEARKGIFAAVSASDVTAFLERYKQRFASPQEYWQKLNQAEITEQDFKKMLRHQLTVSRFLAERFEPFVIVLPSDVEQYYDSVLVPELQQNEQSIPSLSIVENTIMQILTVQETNRRLEDWVRRVRQRANVRVLLFRSPPSSSNLPRELREEPQFEEVISEKLAVTRDL
jgi:hypothetical protein